MLKLFTFVFLSLLLCSGVFGQGCRLNCSRGRNIMCAQETRLRNCARMMHCTYNYLNCIRARQNLPPLAIANGNRCRNIRGMDTWDRCKS